MMTNDALIICEGSKYIRVHSQDGTPIRVSNAWDARHWKLIRDAVAYRDRFPKESQNWQIKVVSRDGLVGGRKEG